MQMRQEYTLSIKRTCSFLRSHLSQQIKKIIGKSLSQDIFKQIPRDVTINIHLDKPPVKKVSNDTQISLNTCAIFFFSHVWIHRYLPVHTIYTSHFQNYKAFQMPEWYLLLSTQWQSKQCGFVVRKEKTSRGNSALVSRCVTVFDPEALLSEGREEVRVISARSQTSGSDWVMWGGVLRR